MSGGSLKVEIVHLGGRTDIDVSIGSDKRVLKKGCGPCVVHAKLQIRATLCRFHQRRRL